VSEKLEKVYRTVDCGHCDATVKAEILATHRVKYLDERSMIEFPDHDVSLGVCPACHEAVVIREDWEGEGEQGDLWSKAVRVWPSGVREANAMIPDIVRVSLEEAQRCHRAAAHTASAVMCGRALEGVCIHFETKERSLVKALAELRERGLIDERLFKWGDELRKQRNVAAHATGERISREDATDLLEFLTAICEYVFVLTPRFQSFMARRTSVPQNNKGRGSKGGGVPGHVEKEKWRILPVGEVHDQPAALAGGHRRNAPWTNVSGSRQRRTSRNESRWVS
jgi:Domain of unknown function (DUF4145)